MKVPKEVYDALVKENIELKTKLKEKDEKIDELAKSMCNLGRNKDEIIIKLTKHIEEYNVKVQKKNMEIKGLKRISENAKKDFNAIFEKDGEEKFKEGLRDIISRHGRPTDRGGYTADFLASEAYIYYRLITNHFRNELELWKKEKLKEKDNAVEKVFEDVTIKWLWAITFWKDEPVKLINKFSKYLKVRKEQLKKKQKRRMNKDENKRIKRKNWKFN